MSYSPSNDRIEKLKTVFFAVEADSFARFVLWERHHKKRSWEDHSVGFVETVGEFGGLPVVVCLWFADIDSRRVLFYECTSRLAHWGMVEEWLEKYVPCMNNTPRRNHSDAMNFHNCLLTIDDENKKAAA